MASPEAEVQMAVMPTELIRHLVLHAVFPMRLSISTGLFIYKEVTKQISSTK
jgi:hypothetical protein